MESKKKVELSVSGMTCTNCAQTVSRQLERSGLQNVNVNFSTGEVSFQPDDPERVDKAVNSINSLGYRVLSRSDKTVDKKITDDHHLHSHDHSVTYQFNI